MARLFKYYWLVMFTLLIGYFVVLKEIYQLIINVIGGDVLSKQGDYYKHNYDNWYFEPNEGTFNQSILKAENYIKNYPEGNYIFVLVIK